MAHEDQPLRSMQRPEMVTSAPITFGLLASWRALHGLGSQRLAALGLHPGQELILMHLFDRDDQTQTEIQHALALDPSTVSRSIRRMEDAGLLTRSPSSDDRRARIVSLTPRGKALRAPLRRLWTTLEQLAETAVPASRRSRLIAALGDLEHAFTDADDG